MFYLKNGDNVTLLVESNTIIYPILFTSDQIQSVEDLSKARIYNYQGIVSYIKFIEVITHEVEYNKRNFSLDGYISRLRRVGKSLYRELEHYNTKIDNGYIRQCLGRNKYGICIENHELFDIVVPNGRNL